VRADISDPGISAAAITANNQTVAYNQSVPLTSIFSVGAGAAQYEVWFSWPEKGMPALGVVSNNGTPIPLDQAVTVSSLSGLAYTGSASQGTDHIWLKAFNGSWNGSWVRASIVDSGSSAQASTGRGAATASGDLGASKPLTIGAGDTLELSSAYSGAMTFLADTGALKLDNASSFNALGECVFITTDSTISPHAFAYCAPTAFSSAIYSG
jgi:hypothetical protein